MSSIATKTLVLATTVVLLLLSDIAINMQMQSQKQVVEKLKVIGSRVEATRYAGH